MLRAVQAAVTRAIPARRSQRGGRDARAPSGEALVVPALPLLLRATARPVHQLLGEPGEVPVRRVGRRLREEAIFIGLWVCVLSTVNAAAMWAAAVVHH